MVYMNMLPTIKTKLEQNGIQVMHKRFDFRTKTDTYIQLPDGQTFDYYNYLHEIPDTLFEGEQVSLGEQAIPEGEPIVLGDTIYESSLGNLWDGDNTALGTNPSLIPIAFVALIIFLIKLVAVFICAYLILQKILHPCGTEPFEKTYIDDCYKVITYPDCSTVTVDSCDPDGPTVVDKSGPPGQDIIELIKWGIVGGVAIVGLYVITRVIPKRRRKSGGGTSGRYVSQERPRPKSKKEDFGGEWAPEFQ